MNIKSILGIFCACMFTLGIATSVNAAPVTTNLSGTIDWISIPNSGTDTYGIGTSTMVVGDTYSYSITYDSDQAMASSVSFDGSGIDYGFDGFPYGGSLSINGNYFSSLSSGLNIGNDIVLPPEVILEQEMIDAGLPQDLSSFLLDQIWMGVSSDDFKWAVNGMCEGGGVGGKYGECDGLEFSVVFVDLSAKIFDSNLIPDFVPSLETIDFAFFDIEQWENGVSVFKAGGVLAKNYSPVAPSWEVSDFLTLCATTEPIVCTPTRAIEFDSLGNLYIENTTDDESGFIDILKLDVSSAYSTSSTFASYSTDYKGVTGLDFDDLESLYVSERSTDGDAGIIRKIDVVTPTLISDVMAFAYHRPTGVDADTVGNVYYSGRRQSIGVWGKVFKIDPFLIRTELNASMVATGIAVDVFGNIFISTPERTDLPLVNRSIYMFEAADAGMLNPIRIATFHEAGGELTFDDDGNLYMISNDQVSIVKLSPNDTDSDGILDYMDNCTLVSNATQLDTDNDGYGNICDADLNQDLKTDLSDFSLFRVAFATADPDADFNGDGTVDLTDFSFFRVMFQSPPGPSGLNP